MILTDDNLRTFDRITSGPRAVLEYLDSVVEKGVKEGRFTLEEAQADPELALRRAGFLIRLNDYRAMLKAIRLIDAARDTETRPRAYEFRAKALMYTGRVAEAQRVIEACVKRFPDFDQGWRLAVVLRSGAGDRKGAKEAFRKYLAVYESESTEPDFISDDLIPVFERLIDAGGKLKDFEFAQYAKNIAEKGIDIEKTFEANPEVPQKAGEASDPREQLLARLRMVSCLDVNEKGLARAIRILKLEDLKASSENPGLLTARAFCWDEPVTIEFAMTKGGLSHIEEKRLRTFVRMMPEALRRMKISRATNFKVTLELDRSFAFEYCIRRTSIDRAKDGDIMWRRRVYSCDPSGENLRITDREERVCEPAPWKTQDLATGKGGTNKTEEANETGDSYEPYREEESPCDAASEGVLGILADSRRNMPFFRADNLVFERLGLGQKSREFALEPLDPTECGPGGRPIGDRFRDFTQRDSLRTSEAMSVFESMDAAGKFTGRNDYALRNGEKAALKAIARLKKGGVEKNLERRSPEEEIIAMFEPEYDAGTLSPVLVMELGWAYARLTDDPGTNTHLLKARRIFLSLDEDWRSTYLWHVRMGYVSRRLCEVRTALYHFAVAIDIAPDPGNVKLWFDRTIRDAVLPQFDLPYARRVENVWENFIRDEARLLEFAKGSLSSRRAMLERIAALLGPVDCRWSVIVPNVPAFVGEREIVTISSDGLIVSGFLIERFVAGMPEELGQRWDFRVGRTAREPHPAGFPYGIEYSTMEVSVSTVTARGLGTGRVAKDVEFDVMMPIADLENPVAFFGVDSDDPADIPVETLAFLWVNDETPGLLAVSPRFEGVESPVDRVMCLEAVARIFARIAGEAARMALGGRFELLPGLTGKSGEEGRRMPGAVSCAELGERLRERFPDTVALTVPEFLKCRMELYAKPSRDPDADLFEDVYRTDIGCEALLSEYASRINLTSTVLRSCAVATGFVYFDVQHPAERASEALTTKDRTAYVKAIEAEIERILESCPEAARSLGTAEGVRYGYVSFLAWDLLPVLRKLAEFFAKSELVLRAGFHTFERVTPPLILVEKSGKTTEVGTSEQTGRSARGQTAEKPVRTVFIPTGIANA